MWSVAPVAGYMKAHFATRHVEATCMDLQRSSPDNITLHDSSCWKVPENHPVPAQAKLRKCANRFCDLP